MKEGNGAKRRRFGVVGGLGALADADVLFKLLQAMPAATEAEQVEVLYQQGPFGTPGADGEATTARKLYIFDTIRDFEKRGVTTVLLPCFSSHTFIDELQANTRLKIVDIVEAARMHVRTAFSGVRRVGVLASGYVREKRLFEGYFAEPEFEVIHPYPDGTFDPIAEAVHGADGIRFGNAQGDMSRHVVELLREACERLIVQGAEVIVPGVTDIALVADAIGPLRVPLVDANRAYALYAASGCYDSPAPAFKIGVVGGVGPAATVDFLQKIVRNTPASRDQDHIKLLVEQNPQIPDRTQNLIGDGADPTVSLYATCKRLEDGDADIIAIPCNTAHAFVERIQPYLGIPIVNMLTETVRYLRETYPALRDVGVLATSGTMESGVYRDALEAQGLRQIAPAPVLQARVMEAIYGRHGVKAGFTMGRCQEDIAAALEGLIAEGVEAVILGCTELPLLLPQPSFEGRGGARVRLVDPTEVLARQCIMRATSMVTMREIKRCDGFPYLLCDGEDPEGNVFQLSQQS